MSEDFSLFVDLVQFCNNCGHLILGVFSVISSRIKRDHSAAISVEGQLLSSVAVTVTGPCLNRRWVIHELSQDHEVLSCLNLLSKFTPVSINCTGILSTSPHTTVLSDPHVSFLHILCCKTVAKGRRAWSTDWQVGWLGLVWEVDGVTASKCLPSSSARASQLPVNQLLNHAVCSVTLQDKLTSVRLL